MSTSNSYLFTDSTQSVVTDAYIELGKIPVDQQPTPSEYYLGARYLNRLSKALMLKNDHSPGMKLWKRHTGFCFLSTNTGCYVLGTNTTSSTYWTESYLTANSGGSNANGATTLNLSNTVNLPISPTTVSSLTGNVANGMYLGVQLDNGQLYWTMVANVISNTQVAIAGSLPYSSSTYNNVIYAFSTLAQPPQVVDWVNLRNITGTDVSLDILTYEEFTALPGKQSPTLTGDPSAVYIETHLVGSAPFSYLYTDVAQALDVTKYLVVSYVQEIQDWVNESDQPDFPKEWSSVLVLSLARALAGPAHAVWTQLQETRYKEAMTLAMSANPKKIAAHFSRRRKSGFYRNVPHR